MTETQSQETQIAVLANDMRALGGAVTKLEVGMQTSLAQNTDIQKTLAVFTSQLPALNLYTETCTKERAQQGLILNSHDIALREAEKRRVEDAVAFTNALNRVDTLATRLDALEGWRSSAKGAMWAMGGIGTVCLALLGYILDHIHWAAL